MKWRVTTAYDVPCYAKFEVEADTKEQAEQLAGELAANHVHDPEWGDADNWRVIDGATEEVQEPAV